MIAGDTTEIPACYANPYEILGMTLPASNWGQRPEEERAIRRSLYYVI
jgi:hypothetical protein